MKRLFCLAAIAFGLVDLVACVSDDNNPQVGTPIDDSGAPPTVDSGLDATLSDGGGTDSGGTTGDAGVDAGQQLTTCADAGTGRCLGILATNQGNPEGLVLHDGYLYWIEEGLPQHIHRIALTGGAAEDLGAAGVASSTLAVDNTNMYWTDQYHGTIYAAPNTGVPDGGATVLAAVDGGSTADLLVDPNRAYWTDFNAGIVYAAALGGGSPTVLASGQVEPEFLATDGTNLYWSQYGASSVMELSLADGGAPFAVASGVSGPTHIQVTAGTVYIASGTTNDIYSVPVTGGTPQIFVATGPTTTASFVYDGATVFWATSGNPGGEVLSALPGGNSTPLALGMTSPGSLTFDATNIYWANFAYGAVLEMAKP
jgi:hypothetical protein